MEGARKRRQTREERAMEHKKLVRISVEVRSGTARFRVGVQTENIKRALGMVGGRYPQGVVKVRFPVETESVFVPEQTLEVAA
jgi:hypothetical protein